MLLELDVLAAAVGDALLARGAMLAVAETTAGGLICARLVSVPGASTWLERGIVAYSRAAKVTSVGASEEALSEHGAVSGPSVLAMAEGVRALGGVAFGLAESGIAGPQGTRRSAKEAGTAVIAVVGPDGERVEECRFAGSRVEVMEQIAERSLQLLLDVVSGAPGALPRDGAQP
jgi:PncC family amidohydrolase